ncbi:MAG: glutaredoxin family protein [Puniceicoccales bacterium]
MKITAYLKPTCGWSRGVRAVLKKYDLAYEDLDIVNNRDLYEEMCAKSGQHLSPCVEIDGVMLADVSGEEVENYLVANQLVEKSNTDTEYPTNQSCSSHRREDPQTVRFF